MLPCSGSSNCGQIAYQVAVDLDVMGVGRLYCLAGLGAHIQGMVASISDAKRIIAIDGCQVACAKKTVEYAGLNVTDWVCVTDEGISKNHSILLEQADVELITRKTMQLLLKSHK
ncbi:putative zinc-binding protein [Chloroflexota bacterium]